MDRARLVHSILLLLPAAACGWSVRVEPGRAATGGPPRAVAADPGAAVPVAGDPGARALYLNHCARCHAPFPPSHAPAKAWPRLVAKYGPRAQLFGEERARVLAWLRSQAG